MTCPFPGMDPWLEAPAEWPDMHHALISEIRNALQPELKARGFYAKAAERVWITEPHRAVYPDVAVMRTRRPDSHAASTAVLTPDEPIQLVLADEELTEGFVEIFSQHDQRLVTAIEVISPSNKLHPQGRALYQQKQRELRDAGVNLVEIDFLRAGTPVVDISSAEMQTLPPWDYLIALGRRGVNFAEVYALTVRSSLPRCRIPLTRRDDDAVLDLPTAFRRAYDAGPYPDQLNYRSPPDPPLSVDDAAWARQILTEKGLL